MAANLYFKFTQTYNGLNDIHIFLFECYFINFFLLQSRSSLKTSPVNEIVYSVSTFPRTLVPTFCHEITAVLTLLHPLQL